jgi:hypothetical protein
MLRDLLSKSQSNSGQDERLENRNPTGENTHASPTQPQKDDEEFVPVNHGDVEDVDEDDEESEMNRVLRPLLGLQRQGQRSRGAAANKYDDLHPYTQILSLSDLEACVALEDAAFPEHERCSRDKVCLALSLTLNPTQHKSWLPKGAMGHVHLHKCENGPQKVAIFTCEHSFPCECTCGPYFGHPIAPGRSLHHRTMTRGRRNSGVTILKNDLSSSPMPNLVRTAIYLVADQFDSSSIA